MIEKIGLSDPYGLDYQDPELIIGAPEIPLSPEAGEKLTISPLRVLLGQNLTRYKDIIRDWCVENRATVVLVCLVAVFATLFSLRSR